MTICFAITAYDKDLHYIDRCSTFIERQSVRPNETIAFVSGVSSANKPPTIDKMFLSSKRASAGKARNECIKNSSSDIICFCDVDDEIHPQKCEIIKKVFSENEKVDAIVHDYNFGRQEFKPIEISNIVLHKIAGIDKTCLLCPIDGKIAHGPICVRRSAIQNYKLEYEDLSYAEDGLFCQRLFQANSDGLFFLPYELINYM